MFSGFKCREYCIAGATRGELLRIDGVPSDAVPPSFPCNAILPIPEFSREYFPETRKP